MLNNNDQEFLMFLVGCLCLALSAELIAYLAGTLLIFLAFRSEMKKPDKKEKEGE